MKIRAKFQLQSIKHHAYGGRTYEFHPNYDDTIPEDQRFMKASPSGRFEITVDNPVVHEEWKIGEFYYADFSPVPKPLAV